MTDREKDLFAKTAGEIEDLRADFSRDKKKFTEAVETIFLKARKKEDVEKVLELVSLLRNEIGEIAPFLSAAINPFLTLMIRNHYYKQVSEHTGLFESCANISVYRLLEDLIGRKEPFRFLTTLEVFRIKKLALFLAKKFHKADVAYRLELELEKEDLEWRDSVD